MAVSSGAGRLRMVVAIGPKDPLLWKLTPAPHPGSGPTRKATSPISATPNPKHSNVLGHICVSTAFILRSDRPLHAYTNETGPLEKQPTITRESDKSSRRQPSPRAVRQARRRSMRATRASLALMCSSGCCHRPRKPRRHRPSRFQCAPTCGSAWQLLHACE